MKLIVGLGNPGKKYQNTRHNLGQNVVLKLFMENHLSPKNPPKLSAQIADFQGIKLAILTTYMNESGIAVRKILDYYQIPTEDLYIIHDDLDLPVGEWKAQFDRGPAGHNGIKSVIDHLGTQSFHRIRLGIGHPVPNTISVEDYVLKPFSPDEKPLINSLVKELTFDNLL